MLIVFILFSIFVVICELELVELFNLNIELLGRSWLVLDIVDIIGRFGMREFNNEEELI